MHSLSLESGRRRWRLLVHGLLPGRTHRLTPKVCWAQLLRFGKGKPGPVAGGDCSSPAWHCTDRRGRVFGCRRRQLLPSTFCSCKSQMIPVQCGDPPYRGTCKGKAEFCQFRYRSVWENWPCGGRNTMQGDGSAGLCYHIICLFLVGPKDLCPKLSPETSVFLFKLQLSFLTRNHMSALQGCGLDFCL